MRLVLPSPRHLQNPLARVLASVLALAMLAVVVIFGLLALAILLVGGLLWYAWFRWRVYRARKQAASEDPDPDIIEGEYVVVHKEHHHDS